VDATYIYEGKNSLQNILNKQIKLDFFQHLYFGFNLSCINVV